MPPLETASSFALFKGGGGPRALAIETAMTQHLGCNI